MAGSQESNCTLEKWRNKDKSCQSPRFSTSIEPVNWQGEGKKTEPAPAETLQESKDSELQFSPLAEENQEEAAPERESIKEAEQVAVIHGVDFSSVVEKQHGNFSLKKDTSDVYDMVSRLNEDIFSHYKNRTGIILSTKSESNSPQPFDEREEGKIISYRGYQMTVRTARCFQELERLIALYFPGRQIIITCTTGGTHLDVRHYEGSAIDFVVVPLSAKESILLAKLAEQAGFTPCNEYLYSSPYKTGDHMHIGLDR